MKYFYFEIISGKGGQDLVIETEDQGQGHETEGQGHEIGRRRNVETDRTVAVEVAADPEIETGANTGSCLNVWHLNILIHQMFFAAHIFCKCHYLRYVFSLNFTHLNDIQLIKDFKCSLIAH